MHFEHLGNVRQHHRHRIALAYSAPGQSRSQAAATIVGLLPGTTQRAVDHGGVVGVDAGSALDETQGRQGDVIDRDRAEPLFINRHDGFSVADC
ncbi:hypothetical protein D3C76_1538380 [compost metagenome]